MSFESNVQALGAERDEIYNGPAGRGLNKRVFVNNLESNVNESDLQVLFSTAGAIVSIELVRDDQSQAKYAVVEYTTPDAANQAVNTLKEQPLNGRPIKVRFDRDPKTRPGRNENGVSTRVKSIAENQVFVGNLPFSTTWQQLKDLAAQFGAVRRADVAMGRDGRSRGNGVVVFDSVEEALACINGLNNWVLDGRTLVARVDQYAKSAGQPQQQQQQQAPREHRAPREHQHREPAHQQQAYGGDAEPGTQVYIGNLPYRTNWQDLKDLCAPFGEVVRSDVAMDNKTNRSRGFGTVRFRNVADAQSAIAALHDQDFNGRKIMVRFDRKNAGAQE